MGLPGTLYPGKCSRPGRAPRPAPRPATPGPREALSPKTARPIRSALCQSRHVTKRVLPQNPSLSRSGDASKMGEFAFFFFLLFLFLFLLFKPGVSIASLCSATTSGREILFERRFVGEADRTRAAGLCFHSWAWAPAWNGKASVTGRAGGRPVWHRHRVPGRCLLLTRSAALWGVAAPGGMHPDLSLHGGTTWGWCPARPACARPTARGRHVPGFFRLMLSRPADAHSAPQWDPGSPARARGLKSKPRVCEAPSAL